MIHFIYGPVGAGKTTYGRTLAAERGAVFFCLDEWMAALFLMDAPSPMTFDWALTRTERCETQMWTVTRQLLPRGVDVILELGFFKREQRDRWRARAAEVGALVEVHVMEVPREVRRERVRARNRGSATYTVEVDDATFDWAEEYYEALGADELRGANIVAV